MKLIPEKLGTAPNYYCTWACQNYQIFQGLKHFDVQRLEGSEGVRLAQDQINEERILGENGWAKIFHPKARKDLYFLMDHGWEENGFFSLELDARKFPSFPGKPPERLKALNERISAEGWRGLAVWVRGNISLDKATQFVGWCKYAGVEYWKIDGGDVGAFNSVKAGKEIYPQLALEYVTGSGGIFHGGGVTEHFPSASVRDERLPDILRMLNVFRSHDVSCRLSVPTTLQRAADVMQRFGGQRDMKSLVNLEDEVIMAAVLGCTMGVMRFPQQGLRAEGDVDLFFNGSRSLKRRMDEVARALRWQRIAPPFPIGIGRAAVSEKRLVDQWVFRRGDTWETPTLGKKIFQSAPAVVARGMELPEVSAETDMPFVIASRFPDDAVAVATLGRCRAENDWYHPQADVTLQVGVNSKPIGIFGYYKSLTLLFDRPLGRSRILGQDLLADTAEDLTNDVAVEGCRLVMNGDLIRRVGLAAGGKDDASDPGMVLAIVSE